MSSTDCNLGFSRAPLGVAARRLLAYGWSAEPRDSYLVGTAIRSVVATFATDPVASEQLLQQAIEPGHLQQYGHEELDDLFADLGVLAAAAPGFLADCYRATFAYREESKERTVMLPSRLLGLSSTRQQDYDQARYLLGEGYAGFLRAASSDAVQALAAVAESYAERRAHASALEAIPFTFRGRETWLLEDHSYIWDAGGLSAGDPEETMLDHFELYLRDLCEEDIRRADALISSLAGLRVVGALLGRTLRQAASFPDTLGVELAGLLRSPGVLAAVSVRQPLMELLEAAFGHLDGTARTAIETTIIGLPNSQPKKMREYMVLARDAYLRAVDAGDLVTDEARQLRQELDRSGEPPTDLMPQSGWTSYTTEAAVSERGADLARSNTQDLLQRAKCIANFANTHLNGIPPRRERASVTTRLGSLARALQQDRYDSADLVVRDEAWESIARAAAIVARAAPELTDRQGTTIREALLAAAERPGAASIKEVDAFDKDVIWSWTPRTEAAAGLCCLMSEFRFVNTEVRETVDGLAQDPNPAVRSRVAEQLYRLADSAPDLLRAIVERFVESEPSARVLTSAWPAVNVIVHTDADSGLTLAEHALAREQKREQPRPQVLTQYAALLVGHYIQYGSEPGWRLITAMTGDLERWREPIRSIMHSYRAALIVGSADRTDAENQTIRDRMIATAREWLTAAEAVHDQLQAQHAGDVPWSEADRARITAALDVAQIIADQLYFASGVFQSAQQTVDDGRHGDEEQRIRLYTEAQDLLATLSRIGYPKAIHHVIELAAACSDSDPRGAFLLIADAVRGGAKWGYHLEHMAQTLVVNTVKLYLAEHRDLFQDDQTMGETLVDILDTFVSAGWPEPRKLVYGLGEIFR